MLYHYIVYIYQPVDRSTTAVMVGKVYTHTSCAQNCCKRLCVCVCATHAILVRGELNVGTATAQNAAATIAATIAAATV